MGETDGVAPARSEPRRKRGPGKRRRSRALRGRRREQLLAAIAANPGARQAELAAEIGISPSQVSVLIAGLHKEKLVVKGAVSYALKQ